MTRKSSGELGLRVISAIFMLIVVVAACWIGGLTFLGLSILLSALLFYEWQAMVRQTPFDGAEALLTAGFVALLLCSLAGYPLVGLFGFIALGLVLELVSNGEEKSDVRWIGLGALYCAIPAVTFPLIREEGGFGLMMFLFLVVWVTDIAAYFVGRQFGGPKLLPAVSPKKTWSGGIGGLVFSLLLALAWGLAQPDLPMAALLVAAAVLSVVSQAGDFFESWVKRLFNVKDSSQLIPGHGGFLDRVDGLVAAAVPVAVVIALNVGQ